MLFRSVENLCCSDVLSECFGVRSVDVGSLIKMNTKHQRFGGRSNMMDITKRKKRMAVSFIMVLVMATTMLVASSASAFATSYAFSFRIQPHQQNAQEKHGRYRGNVYPGNRWWVILSKSGEGKGALTDFWLEAYDGTNVSPYRRVKCGNGWYSQTAYETARMRTVFLTAEDNKNKAEGYNVSGRWQPHE